MKIKRALRWLVFQCAYSFLLWHAMHGHINAGRLLGTWTWFCCSMVVVGAFSDEVKKAATEKGRSIPSELSHGLGFAYSAIFFWNGWTTLGVISLIAEAFEAALFSDWDKKKVSQE